MARFCNNCGASLADNQVFCTECGTAASVTPPPAQNTYSSHPDPNNLGSGIAGSDQIPPKGSKYEPITTKGYIGIMLLMCIPVVGIVLMIIWAFGGCKKVNKQAFARAALIMMAISLVLSLIFGFAIKKAVGAVTEAIGWNAEAPEEGDSDESNLLAGLAGLSTLGDASENASDEKVTNSDIEELEALGEVLQSLEKLTGEGEAEENSGSLSDLVEKAEEINREAEAANDGWPKSLREYPGGTASAVASYRTEITGTSREEMMGYIDDLKKDGFEFRDFYDFGFSEEEMLNTMNAWWATDGEIYLSISCYEDTVTIDHTKELPDLGSYFE